MQTKRVRKTGGNGRVAPKKRRTSKGKASKAKKGKATKSKKGKKSKKSKYAKRSPVGKLSVQITSLTKALRAKKVDLELATEEERAKLTKEIKALKAKIIAAKNKKNGLIKSKQFKNGAVLMSG